jgi:hypothetical protein
MVALRFLLKALFWALVLLLPVLGAWVGSSLAAFHNGPTWLPILCAVLAFPFLPLAWEALGAWRYSRKTAAPKNSSSNDVPKRFLRFSDRLVLRTLAINAVLLAGLLGVSASDVFTALSTRGDWFLDGSQASWVPKLRPHLFAAADKLEWLWDLTHDNPFANKDDDGSSGSGTSSSGGRPAPLPSPKPGSNKNAKPKASAGRHKWPFERRLHPIVRAMTPADEVSIASVARYIKERVQDPFMRVKALHDYVADRIAYDAVGVADKTYPGKQQPETVFANKYGVCAGYAYLLAELARQADAEIVYVGGYSRDMNGEIGGQGHAWNAAKIEGKWYLLDATWNAGSVKGRTFKKNYSVDYFLTPPEVFGINHLPDDKKWQLRETPISRGEFMRLPNLRPRFFSAFRLIQPNRSQTTVDGDFAFVFSRRSTEKHIFATYGLKEGTSSKRCNMKQDGRAICPLPASGTYRVQIWIGPKEYGKYWFSGQFEVHRR